MEFNQWKSPSNDGSESKSSKSDRSDRSSILNLGPVLKSPLDIREYRALKLPNGLKVILISTSELAKSSGIKTNQTCHLKRVLQFNKTYLGLDDKFAKVRCECRMESLKRANKETSTTTLSQSADDSTVEASVSSEISVTDAIKAINNLVYGETEYEAKLPKEHKLDMDEYERDIAEEQECSAYLTVGAGWFNDPDDMPGMAHFCEHASFLGSKKFPSPNQLFRLIDPYDGYCNAYTDGGKTVFEVATSSEIFGVALEMLADMIGFPTLRNDLVIKEVEAVDSEFSLRQDDMPKYFQLLGSLAKEGHPLRKMDVGNRETLRVPNFHKKLVEWRDSHYCANYITLALEAPMSLIDLERLALKHFSNIPSCPLPAPKDRVQWQECPFENEVFHRIYHVPSVYHSEFMAIQWAIDAAAWKNFSVKPLEYLASLISHKGEGGLYHFLNHFGWASNVIGGCWVSDVCCNQYTSLFSIYIDMTEDGFRKQDYLLEAVFGYIEMLIRTGPSHSFFQECQKQQADYFHQRAVGYNSTYAESASVWLQHLPAQHVLAASALTSIYDPNLIETCTKMLEIEKCNVMIFSQKYLKREKLDMMEKFYKTPYASYEFPKGLVEKVRRLESHLAQLFYMPAPNRLLREITCCGNQQKNMIRSGPLMVIKGKCSLYYKEKKFRSIRGPFPQAKYVFWLQSPVTVDVQGSHAKMNLFSNFLNMMIESKFVAALAAHHNIEATVKHNRLQISITGPTHQLPQLAKDFFKVITVFEKLLDPTTFKVGKSRYVEDLDNVSLDNTWLAWDIVSFLFSSHHQLSTDRKSEVEAMDLLEFVRFVKAFKKKVYIVGYLYGYVTTAHAFSVVQSLSAFMKRYPQLLTPQELPLHQCPKFPVGENIVKVRSRNPRVHTSVVINGYQFGNLNRKYDEIVTFLAKTMSDSAYLQLRTNEQLGYVVVVYHEVSYSVTSLLIELATQPKNYTTAYCNGRIDRFVSDFYVVNLSSPHRFTEFLKGKPPVDFSLDDIQKIYKRYLNPDSGRYRKLSIQIVGSLSDEFVTEQKSPDRLQRSFEQSQSLIFNPKASLFRGTPISPAILTEQGINTSVSVHGSRVSDQSNRSVITSTSHLQGQKNILKTTHPSSSKLYKSQQVRNIQEFRNGLEFYPNTHYFAFSEEDDSDSSGSEYE